MGIVRNSFRSIRQPLFQMRYGAIRKYGTDSKVTNIAESKIQQEQFAIAQKQGEFWECIGRKPDLERGYIYSYTLKKEYDLELRTDNVENDRFSVAEKYDAIHEKFKEIFPAVEPRSLEEARASIKPIQKFDLGYDIQGNVLLVPDQEALDARFEKARTNVLATFEIAPLKIASSEGVADDLSFLDAYLKFDVLLSTGREFIHDHFAHLISTLYWMLSSYQYAPERQRLRENVKRVQTLIINAEKFIDKKSDPGERKYFNSHLLKIKTSAGSMVDRIWVLNNTHSSMNISFNPYASDFIGGFQGPNWGNFYEKKFGENVTKSKLDHLWEYFKNIEPQSVVAEKN